jgi:hypothetical protein
MPVGTNVICVCLLIALHLMVRPGPQMCPCHACKGTLFHDARTIRKHQLREDALTSYYMGQAVPTAAVDGYNYACEPPPPQQAEADAEQPHPSMFIDDGDNYVDGNPMHSLAGWDERITVHTRQPRMIATAPPPAHTTTGRPAVADTGRGSLQHVRLDCTTQGLRCVCQRPVGLRDEPAPREQHHGRLWCIGEYAQNPPQRDSHQGALLH